MGNHDVERQPPLGEEMIQHALDPLAGDDTQGAAASAQFNKILFRQVGQQIGVGFTFGLIAGKGSGAVIGLLGQIAVEHTAVLIRRVHPLTPEGGDAMYRITK